MDNSFLLKIWYLVILYGSILSFVASILIMIYYYYKEKQIEDFNDKYNFIYNKEIYFIRKSVLFVGVAFGGAINLYGKTMLVFDFVWFLALFFASIAGTTLIIYVGNLVLKFYYPTKLNQKLDKWRYMPRINLNTGNTMRLLSENEEDVHLEEGMIAEENVFTFDYDVWIDDETNETKIEKYHGHMQAKQCNSCGFHTMKLEIEEIVEPPTLYKEGRLIKHYTCQYCQSIRDVEVAIAKSEIDSAFTQIKDNYTSSDDDNKPTTVKVKIFYKNKKKNFEFQSINQAKNFLNEYEQSS